MSRNTENQTDLSSYNYRDKLKCSTQSLVYQPLEIKLLQAMLESINRRKLYKEKTNKHHIEKKPF